VDALVIAARRSDGDFDSKVVLPAFEAIADAAVLSRDDVVRRIEPRGAETPASRQDALFPGPLLARLAKVAVAEDLPLLERQMRRFGDLDRPERQFIVEAALHISDEAANSYLVSWFNRYKSERMHIGVGLAMRPSLPRDQLERLVARADARTQLAVKGILRAPDMQAMLLGFLRDGTVVDKLAASELAGLTGQSQGRAELRALLAFRDARYYPNDAVVRHVAMASLIRLALARSNPAPQPAPAAAAP
jgi:hypothetical protein